MTSFVIKNDLTKRRAVVAPVRGRDAGQMLGFSVLMLSILVDPTMFTSLLLGGALRVIFRKQLTPSIKRWLTWVVWATSAPLIAILVMSVWQVSFGGEMHASRVGFLRVFAAPLCLLMIVQTILERRRAATAPRFVGHDFEAWIDPGTQSFNVALHDGVISAPLGHWVIEMSRGETTVYSSRDVPLQRLDYYSAIGMRSSSYTTGGYRAIDRHQHQDQHITYTLRVVAPILYKGYLDPEVAVRAMTVNSFQINAQDDTDHHFPAWIDAHTKQISADRSALHAQWKQASDSALKAVRAQVTRHPGDIETYAWSPSKPTTLATYHLIESASGRVFAWAQGQGDWVRADEVELPEDELALLTKEQTVAVRAALLKAQHICARGGVAVHA